MYSSNFCKYLTATVAGFGVFSFGSLVMPSTANAFSVGYGNSFEQWLCRLEILAGIPISKVL